MNRRKCVAPANVSGVTGYRRYKCRCYRCGLAESQCYARRKAALRTGAPTSPMVDSAPVVQHLNQLRAANVSAYRAALAAGVPVRTAIRYGFGCKEAVPSVIKKETADALLAVTENIAMQAGDLVLAVGTRRRARALAAIGWPLGMQAQMLGIKVNSYTGSITHKLVTVRRARQVAELYDKLSLSGGPSSAARRIAKSKHWAPPMAWDDDTIDDPRAQPQMGEPGDDVPDPVLVERALAGQRIVLSGADRVHAVTAGRERGLPMSVIGQRIGASLRVVRRIAEESSIS